MCAMATYDCIRHVVHRQMLCAITRTTVGSEYLIDFIQKSNDLALFCVAVDRGCLGIAPDTVGAAICRRVLFPAPTAAPPNGGDFRDECGADLRVGSMLRSCCRFVAAALSRCCFGGTSGTDDELLMNRCSAARSAAFFESEFAVTVRLVALRLRVRTPSDLAVPRESHKKSSCSAIGTSSSKIRTVVTFRHFCVGAAICGFMLTPTLFPVGG